MLIDPLLVAVAIKHFPTFFTRSDVFRKGWVDRTLRFLGLLPVYRIRDGYSSLKRNQAIFDIAVQRLHANGALLMFPEGSSEIVQRLRPLSKGFTRVVFDVLRTDKTTDLHILPVGLNYREVATFPDSVSLHFSKPIVAQEYVQVNDDGTVVEEVTRLRSDMQLALQKIVTSIPEDNYVRTREALLNSDADLLDPGKIAAIIQSNEWPEPTKKSIVKVLCKKCIKAVLVIALLPIYLFWRQLKKSVDDIEYSDSILYLLLIFVVPLYLLLMGLVISVIFNLQLALLLIGLLVLLELIYVKFL